jgi:hypothetical protein
MKLPQNGTVSFSIRLAAFQASGGAHMKLHFLTTCCQLKPDKDLNQDKPEITNYKHHLILKLGK